MLKIGEGRFFNEAESNSGTPVIVLGFNVVEGLFENADQALGKKIRLYGQNFTVIGVTKKQGFSTFGNSNDDIAIFPVNFVRRLYGDNSDLMTPNPLAGFNIDTLDVVDFVVV